LLTADRNVVRDCRVRRCIVGEVVGFVVSFVAAETKKDATTKRGTSFNDSLEKSTLLTGEQYETMA